MPSPFPGMNPYLEQDDAWRDFRLCFIVAASEQLNRSLRPGYHALIRLNEFFFDSSEREETECPQPDAIVNAGSGGPKVVRLPSSDVERESYIEVHETKNREAVAIIVLLSRGTKWDEPRTYRDQYMAWRTKVLGSPIHFIEIDLLRGGSRPSANDAPGADYCALVSRWQQWPWATVWPMRLRETLPCLPVPLADGVPDASLDLQAALQRVWVGARYDLWIYEGVPDPLLSSNDAEWARQFLPRTVANG